MTPVNSPLRISCAILDVEVTPTTLSGLVQTVSATLRNRERLIIVGHNLHSAFLYHTDDGFRSFYDLADTVLCDGAPVLWDAQFTLRHSKKRLQRIERIGSTDWIPSICGLAELSTICVVGASRTSNERFVSWCEHQNPRATIIGIPGDPWDERQAESAREKVSRSRPQLILIGLGMPLQEQFARSLTELPTPAVIATVGGAIDQLSEVQKNAPRGIGKYGLEWVWRLSTQPKRLWRRYLIEPWQLLVLRFYKWSSGK